MTNGACPSPAGECGTAILRSSPGGPATVGPSALAAKRAALDTRDRKEALPRGELFRRWRETGRLHGWEERQARQLLGQNRRAPAPVAEQDQRQAAARITEQLSHFPKRELVRRLAEAVQARGLGLRAVEAAAAAGLRRLVPLGPHRGEAQYTTREMLRLEAALLDGAVARRGEAGHVLPRREVDRVLAGHRLSAEQQAAVRHLTTGPDGIQVVSGLAGSGKTAMLGAAREAWVQAGFTVFGACLSGKAAAGLEAGAGIPSHTLAHTLKELGRGRISLPGVSLVVKEQRVAPHAPAWSPLHGLAVPHLAFEVGGRHLGPRSVLVVDEAGMVGTRQLHELLDHAAVARAKVVLVGDARQLPAIGAGAPFRALQDLLGAARLDEIRRQREPWAREVVRDLSEGRAARALGELERRGRIRLGDGHEDAGRQLVADWAARGDPQGSLILAATQEEAGWLNAAAQAARRAQGALQGEPLRHRHEAFQAGDRILCGRNSSLYGVKNGHLGTVERLGKDRLHAVLDDGRRVILSLEHYPHVGLGYAVTTHKAQGMTTENAFVLVSEAMQSREHLAGLPALAPRVPVRTLNPFDARGAAWDVAADITTGADAAQFAQLLIPETGRETQRFFTDAARDLLRAAVEGLQARSPGRWTLRDVILLVQSRERLQAFLTPWSEVLARVTPHLKARECASVLSTLATRTGPLSIVAALWEAAPERFSLTQWLAGESVLVFAHDPVHHEALEPVNRAFFARAANLLLSRTTHDRTYVVLDEAREAGRLDGLRSLLNTGRS